MKQESMEDVIEIVTRALQLGDREDGWTRENVSELGGRLERIKFSKIERLALYPVLEAAGITGQRAQAEALGIGKSTVGDDRRPEPAKPEHEQRPEPATPELVGIKDERGKRNGPTLKQSLRGLEHASMSLQALAEGLDGDLFGDWTRLFELPDAQPFFDVIAQSLPIVNARLKRALRERTTQWQTAG